MKALFTKLAIFAIIFLIVVVDFASKVMSVAVDAMLAGALIGFLWPLIAKLK